jgi:hypothetical protein
MTAAIAKRGWASSLRRARGAGLQATETEIAVLRGKLDALVGPGKVDELEADADAAGYMDPWDRLGFLSNLYKQFKDAAR